MKSIREKKGLIRFFKGFTDFVYWSGYSVAVGDFNGDGTEGKTLASVKKSC